MTQKELRTESLRLLQGETIDDSYDLIDIYLEYFFLVIRNQKDYVNTVAQRDAKMVNQMMFTKIAHLKQVVKGIDFMSKDNVQLNKIIDPTFVGVLIRNFYETVGMFNAIYVNPKTNDEKIILYNLWVIAGLNYRQKIGKNFLTSLNRDKILNEQISIKNYTNEIENTELYKSLTEKNKKKIGEKIKQKDFRLKFDENNNVVYLDWQDLVLNMGIKEKIMGDMYTFFSLYAHPSNVSVFQFLNFFDKDKRPFIEMTNFHLRNVFFLISSFIADYIKYFPNTIDTYNKLSLRDQIVINWVNIFARGDDYSINDAILKLG